MSEPAHLIPTVTDRGFSHLPPIPSRYGGYAFAYESSLAEGPHVWLRIESPVDLNEPEGPTLEAVCHMASADALRLSEQLRWLVESHYQGPPEPEEAPDGPR